jgi:hypothetical protein
MAAILSKAFRLVLVLLFPSAGRVSEVLDALSMNVSANLLDSATRDSVGIRGHELKEARGCRT